MNERHSDFIFIYISINDGDGMKFEVVDRNGKYSVVGFDGFSIRCDNRFDADKLCSYLNGQDRLLTNYREQNIQYYTVLSKIKFIVDDIHQSTGELHILEKAIKIKNLLKEVLDR